LIEAREMKGLEEVEEKEGIFSNVLV